MFGELRERRKPDVISFNAVVSACGVVGNWRRGLGLVEEMKAERTLPDVTTYSAAITACEKGGCVEEALKVFGELRERHKPNVISFSAAVSVLGALCGRKASSTAPCSTGYGTPARVCARRSASARAQRSANAAGATTALQMISSTRKFGSERF